MPMYELHVGLDAKGRFQIDLPIKYAHLGRGIPARFSKVSRKWTAGVLRGSIRSIERLRRLPDVRFGISPAAQAAIDNYEASLKPSTESFPAGYTPKTTPMPHQQRALEFCWPRKGVALDMEMGTGKSKVAIDLAAAAFLGGEIFQLQVICPASIMTTWAEEVKTHCPVNAVIGIGAAPKPREGALSIMIISIEGLGISKASFDAAADFVRRAKTMGVVDESSRIKEQSAKRSQNAHLLAAACPRRLILNGTLIGNSPLDLWSQYEYVDPKIIGQEWFDFRACYAEFGGFEGRQIIGYKNMQELIETVAPWTFTVKKSEVMADLPPKSYEIRRVKPNATQKAALKAIKQKPLFVIVDGKRVKTEMALERMMRVQQVAAGLISYVDETSPEFAAALAAGKKPESTVERMEGGNPKIRDLLDLLSEFSGKAIIWCKFTEEIHWIRDELVKEYGADSTVLFYGEDPEAQDVARHRLQNDPKCRFFIGNIASGAIGITLTAATLMIYITNTFSYLDRAQSEDRFHRKGQTLPTTVVDILMEDTIDELCLNVLKDKKDMAEYVSAEINAANLRQLIGA